MGLPQTLIYAHSLVKVAVIVDLHAAEMKLRSLQWVQSRFNSNSAHQTATSILKPPLLDIARIVENPAAIEQNCIARSLPKLASTVPEIVKANRRRLSLIQARSPLQLRRHIIHKQLRSIKNQEKRISLGKEAVSIKNQLAPILAEENETIKRLNALVAELPNFTHPQVPHVETEIRKIGSLQEKGGVKDHVEIAESLNLLDIQMAAKTTGHAWYYLKGMGVQLELALISYAIEMAVRHGWKLVKPPDVVRTELALACGFHPRDQRGDQIYQLANVAIGDAGADVDQGTLCLSGTAEIPLAAMHLDTIFKETELPVKYVGLGTAYRAEAGSRGRESRGLYRVHQFTKVELFAWTEQGKSDQMLEEILKLQEQIIEGLGLHARILDMPADELGNAAYRKYDIEAWMYGRQAWGEVTSASNCTDYQSRRLGTRYRRRDAKVLHAHTLNGTAMAVPRMIIAILESGLRNDGSVEIPAPLQKFIGADLIR